MKKKFYHLSKNASLFNSNPEFFIKFLSKKEDIITNGGDLTGPISL
jgi:hypothetical protein